MKKYEYVLSADINMQNNGNTCMSRRLRQNLCRRRTSLRYRTSARQHLCAFSTTVGAKSQNIDLRYLLELPPAGERGCGLVLYLHGASGRDDEASVRRWGLSKANYPQQSWLEHFLILAPICPRRLELDGWTGKRIEWTTGLIDEAVLQLLTFIQQQYSSCLDPRRIYLTGPSMGGLGSWMMGARHPERFAALAPMCGGGKPLFAPLLVHKPIHFVHAANDICIDVVETDKLVEALRKAGNTRVKYSRPTATTRSCCRPEFAGHNCWDDAYADSGFWEWLWMQQLGEL